MFAYRWTEEVYLRIPIWLEITTIEARSNVLRIFSCEDGG